MKLWLLLIKPSNLSPLLTFPTPAGVPVKITSPINHADGSCIPFFIYHGGNDKTVLINESENLYSKLKVSGAKEIYFQRITDGPHSVRHERITKQMLNFFDKYLHDNISVIVDDSEFSLK